jgi:cation diffusion facilitator family transporter
MASSKLPIYSALVANLAIAVTKFIAAAVTGSSAMISEGIHSAVDTANELLLLLGISKSKKPADKKRPFGYGRELYFWSFIVSILIFALGGGLAFYEGITHIQHPNSIENPKWSYIVLIASFVFNLVSFLIALKEFNKSKGEKSFWQAVKKSKDPSNFVILFEDAGDVLGVAVALAGVYFGHKYNNPYYDGIASIIIGVILTAMSFLLAKESRSLLMGESVDEATVKAVITIAENDDAVTKVFYPLSVYLAPEEIVLVLETVFKNELTTKDLNKAIERIQHKIQKDYPDIKQIFIEPHFADSESFTLKHQ